MEGEKLLGDINERDLDLQRNEKFKIKLLQLSPTSLTKIYINKQFPIKNARPLVKKRTNGMRII